MNVLRKFSPPVNRQMRVLDKSFFQKEVSLLVAAFPNPKFLGDFVKSCKGDFLLMSGVKHIVPINGTKGVLLREDIDSLESYRDLLSSTALAKIAEYDVEILPYTLKLDYSFWKADDILHAVLPEHLTNDIPTGFAQAGHIAHFNLRSEFKEYGPLIGQVILDKNSKIETVVDKVDSIDTKFRTFKMKVLAGKDDFVVEQNESGCKFRFDFSSVYWNLRLSTEHDRLISQFQPNEVVGDVFAGVGPFAVPAGRKNALVLANDLNPESYKYLKENIRLNNVEDFVRPSNLDGRDFIRNSPSMILNWAKSESVIEKRKTVKRRKTDSNTQLATTEKSVEITQIQIPQFISNYVMNLPDSALTFLDEFVGLYTHDEEVERIAKSDPNFRLPIINVHCFEKYSSDEPEPTMDDLHRRVHSRIIEYIQYSAPFEAFNFHLVRKVAPTKFMFCVTFELPWDVAFKKKF
ncbi:hypothetical protein METBIDRAFT_30278 [Metschnikowia bicuspidata var. bicuspidata NRRL YB-4993]|uniref:tRNA (guanine(37)-N1)-methyltransferase n=1 Tax=Metschnikowia bicuspidata var. bicuspidata NRRL YB-4993 TaxID=869754 RepID=A0A1A0HIT1_9ASCO|nr:hypothetical protein METBIDRAFT_30278 [Metschnikowia bicuspidata var. bicuspidata NRRL YB-4993]OBA23911.1 hypothetical protein METBIDRAFT_30278 [Metschnikowia bicuspidata var. bicuspidata NRRL YB-4993]